ncbi:MAG: 50S ribosomal protein L5 [Fidelibacterota bacterium]
MPQTKIPAGNNGYRPNLLTQYRETSVPEIQKKLGLSHPLQVSRLEKIVLNVGVGKAKDEPGSLDHAMDDLTAISGQRAVITRARKAISNFKIRAGDPVGCRVTLRGWRMYEFLERLVKIALPRVRDFSGFSLKSFDGRGNFHFGLEEQIVFPEIDYDKIDKIRGLNVSIVTTAESDDDGYELLRSLGFPFRERVTVPAGESTGEGA